MKDKKNSSIVADLISVLDVVPPVASWLLQLALTLLTLLLVIGAVGSLVGGEYLELFMELVALSICAGIRWLTEESEPEDPD